MFIAARISVAEWSCVDRYSARQGLVQAADFKGVVGRHPMRPPKLGDFENDVLAGKEFRPRQI
jgi:hypothetical protein